MCRSIIIVDVMVSFRERTRHEHCMMGCGTWKMSNVENDETNNTKLKSMGRKKIGILNRMDA